MFPPLTNQTAYRCLRVLFTALGLLCGAASPLVPQTQATGVDADPRQSALLTRPMPERFEERLAPLGKRLTTEGKELIAIKGTLTQGSTSSEITLVWQLPGVFSIVENGGQGRKFTFDANGLKNSGGPIAKSEQQFLDAIILDWPESLLAAVDKGVVVLRSLGRGFKPAPGEDASKPDLDLYQFSAQFSPATAGMLISLYEEPRLIGFDSSTGLLATVRHVNQLGDVISETTFSEWNSVSGETFPGKVTYLEDGKALLTFTVKTAAAGPMQQQTMAGGQ